MKIHNFRELKIWKDSIEFTKDIYILISSFPSDEKFGIISQIKRSAVSIPSNIAEGSGRGSNIEFSRFLGIALASAYELETQLIIANKLGFIDLDNFNNCLSKLHEIQKMIFSFQKTLNNDEK
jgi:four helix bundle protein